VRRILREEVQGGGLKNFKGGSAGWRIGCSLVLGVTGGTRYSS
jgi:hypothetical protein